MPLSRDDVRNKLLAYKSKYAKREPVELDWFPEAGLVKDDSGATVEDNRLQIREMMGDESMAFTAEQAKDPNRAVGRVISKCLLMPDGQTPAFNETDLQVIMSEMGSSVLLPLLMQIQAQSGANTAVADAIKNLPTTPDSASTTN
jgi:hypothetical protein